MKPKSKVIQTPAGKFPFPMNPAFTKQLEDCSSDEDLFLLAESPAGFINPDAFTEINSRGLYSKFKEWKSSKNL